MGSLAVPRPRIRVNLMRSPALFLGAVPSWLSKSLGWSFFVAVAHVLVGVEVAKRVECGGLPPLFEDASLCIPIPKRC